MRLRINTNNYEKLELINKEINKHIDPTLICNVQHAIEAVNKIWSRDVVVKKYTSHKLDHNIRVLYYCFELIKTSRIKIDKTGYYILTMSALLHDFGMQCNDKEIINKYAKGEKLTDETVQTIVRKNHAKICVDWMKKLYNESSPSSQCGKLISLIDPRHMNPICEVINFHSGRDLFELKENLSYSDNNNHFRLMPIILILRLADELDIGCERSDNDISLRDDLTEDNLSYFWLHYITNISFVSNNILRITIETNSFDKDKHGFFKEIIYDAFMKKNKPLLDLLESNCNIHISIECELKTNDFLEKFNPLVYDYLISKYSMGDDYFDNIIKIIYPVPDVGDVFDLDNVLLPMLYEENENYAVTKEQAYKCAKINSFMTIGAYKNDKVIGYLTLWPVSEETLNKLLSFEIMESEVDFQKDIYTYKEKNINLCWYVSGLGVRNEERGRKNDPNILQLLIEKAIHLVREELIPRGITIDKIGAVVYSRTAENLCLRHFNMKVVQMASYDINGYVPKSVCVSIYDSNAKFINEIKKAYEKEF